MAYCLLWLNEGGLILALIGALILFFWRLPSAPTVNMVPQQDQSPADLARDAERARLFFLVMARLGLGLIIIGFAFQVVAKFPYLQ